MTKLKSNKLHIVFLCLSLILIIEVRAEDMGQFLGGTFDEATPLQKAIAKDNEKGKDLGQPFIMEEKQKIVIPQNVEDDSAAIMQNGLKSKENEKISERQDISSYNQATQGSGDSKNFLEYKNSDLLKDMKDKGDKNFSFMFYKDTFDYKNKGSDFDKVFRGDSSDQLRATDNGKKIVEAPLMLRFSGHELLYRGFFNLGLGAGLGVGYNGGKGRFTDGTVSQVNFSLWTIPVDLSAILEFPLMPWVKLSITGGPSVLGLMQNRSDLPDGNKRKSNRQMSPGYFAAAKVNIALSQLFPGSSHEFLSAYKITRYFLSIEGRTQSYTNFQSSDLEVSGSSLGAGFTFEFF